jgi:hypothetical protein
MTAGGVGKGRFEVTGSMEAYFASGALFNAFVNNTALTLSFTLGSVTGEKYTFYLPKIKFEADPVNAGSIDQELVDSVTWRGLYDPTEECTLKVTRAVA